MNILIISQRLPYPPNKGEKIRIFNQIAYLAENGYSVTLACCVEPDEESQATELMQQTGCQLISCRTGFRWWQLLIGLVSLKPLSVGWFYSRQLQSLINQHLHSTDTPVVYCTSSAVAEYAARLPRDITARRVVDFMDLDSHKWADMSGRAKVPMSLVYRYESIALLRYEKRIQRDFDGCVFISDAERQIFLNALSPPVDNVYVVGNGINVDEFYPPAPDQPESTSAVLLFAGVMDYFPNVDAMLWFCKQVWPLIRERRPDAELIIAGMNPSPAIRELADQPGIQVTGFVDEILPYFHAASVFVAPFQIARGVQNKILQAFACELAVVATAIGAEGIECETGVHLEIADQPDEFATAVLNLLEDASRQRKIVDNAAELIQQHYSWQQQQRPLLEILSPETALSGA